ncbi:hypothetical protein EDB92DRAFT_665487 [Lactarius akahatsu]|uniref:Uncharacterized protein n=1 Tax=Lactarius akahatsu TaxID=416441 RepID=A0AAD4LK53_9AGAM|nr:hypothetical protein EDB92DRAFT_665487 [Lactarius akahatsu]
MSVHWYSPGVSPTDLWPHPINSSFHTGRHLLRSVSDFALNTEVTNPISGAATPTAVINGFRHHQFFHSAYQGTLEAGRLFEAGFELYGDERLTLLEIVRSHVPTAEFAFLSARHTAEVTEGSIVADVLLLAPAVQFCGFKSVVAAIARPLPAREKGNDSVQRGARAVRSNMVHPSATRLRR